ncbi:SRPBCC family protein [Brevundimonas sp. S30B]|uniref:SRPBCC family protein n=1 Tax=unclassified Brevundimonas TaxID=2622653 RepID=UPI001072EB30|nr:MULTISPECIES: SRPBCC family protein [unclassified Brevundimonas]QBX37286.1 SRPBCC family protein [Brevundimonas sp. MF30-B]TFW03921.1 SRPBCC family protein [Brevundimonas sp. S30B]
MFRPAPIILSTLVLSLAAPAVADVRVADAGGFKIGGSIVIAASPARVWTALVHPDDWWSRSHRWFAGSRLTLDATPGGCWCEVAQDGGGARHLSVAMVQPERRLVLHGALGPLNTLGVSGALDIVLTPTETGTSLEWTYSVGGFAEGGLQAWAAPVDAVLSAQIQALGIRAEAP